MRISLLSVLEYLTLSWAEELTLGLQCEQPGPPLSQNGKAPCAVAE